jgi:hypothetical protein
MNCVIFFVRMIPAFDEFGLLPPGIHWAAMGEVRSRYALNLHRRRLMDGFERAVTALNAAGCQQVYLNGSFVTAKEFPADYDACWDAIGVRIEDLDPVLLDFSRRRSAQKAKFLGELFPAQTQAEAGSPYRTFLEFFQHDKESGNKKGIIGISIVTIV